MDEDYYHMLRHSAEQPRECIKTQDHILCVVETFVPKENHLKTLCGKRVNYPFSIVYDIPNCPDCV